jgi:peroxiredoxin
MSQRDVKWQCLRIGLLVAALGIARGAVGGAAASRIDAPALGARVDDFVAEDFLGKSHVLSEFGHGKIVVLAFLGVDCPLAKLYTPRLSQLARKYQTRAIVFVGVDSNRQDGVTSIAAFARQNEVPFPVLKDLRQRIAFEVGATRTPQVVVLDCDRRIRYRGRVDDQYGFIPTDRSASYHKPQPDRMDLEVALDELLANKAISKPETDVAGCLIGRDRRPDVHSDVTYTKDVAPILNKNCVSCHRAGQIGPFSLTSYDEVAGWADMIAEVTAIGRMPPWHADPKYGTFSNDARLSERDKQSLAEWAVAGAPEGNRTDLPSPPTFTDRWTIPMPDQVLYMCERPFDVPATGVVELQNFLIDPGWKEDRWLSAIELRAGNPSVVHHIVLFVVPPDGRVPPLRSDDCFLCAFVPGFRPETLPAGFARRIQAGSKLIFNVHYTPNGVPQQDRSYLGLKFADSRAVRRQATICGAINSDFVIPPRSPDYAVRSSYTFQRDSLLLSLAPHMHLRGKDFLFEATYPDGRYEVLLWVPRYDFGWQTMYRLDSPKLMPEGTVLNCVSHFDNSEGNLNNPDPSAAVRFGWQSFEEMMVGFFEIAPAQEGLIAENRWALAFKFPFSSEQILAVVLTMVNITIVGVLIVRMIRARLARSNKGVPRRGAMQ